MVESRIKNSAFFLLFPVFLVLGASLAAAEDDPVYGPRFEAGAGVGYLTENVRPRWVQQTYTVGMLTGSMRVFKGLSIQGGIDYGRGGEPDSDSLSWGDYRLDINEGTYNHSRWAGIRYELPMRVLKRDILRIYSLYGAVGMTWAEYGVQSNKWIYKSTEETDEKGREFPVADLRGQYAVFAARWRIDNPDPKQAESWLGAYGIDVGVKYSRLNENDVRYSNIEPLPSDFSNTQLFLTGFVKFDIFE